MVKFAINYLSNSLHHLNENPYSYHYNLFYPYL